MEKERDEYKTKIERLNEQWATRPKKKRKPAHKVKTQSSWMFTYGNNNPNSRQKAKD